MKFTDIKNQIKNLWEYDGEFVWTSDEFEWFSCLSPTTSSSFKNKNSYFLEFYNDARDNFFRIYDSNGDILGIIDGNELSRSTQFDERFCNFIFDGHGCFMFSKFRPQ
jgi:hypothetical protein